jgi:nucleotide-binding universal stress UspA family protein
MSWLPKRCVVVPIDFSDESFAALDLAWQFVAGASALHVIHVLPRIDPIEPESMWTVPDNESRSRHVQQALRQRLADPKHQEINLAVAFGEPGHEIADYAKRVGAELIVLPSHGRTGLAHLLIGSVAERVVRFAHCPVLVMRQ